MSADPDRVRALLLALANQGTWEHGITSLPGDWTEEERDAADRATELVGFDDNHWSASYRQAAEAARPAYRLTALELFDAAVALVREDPTEAAIATLIDATKAHRYRRRGYPDIAVSYERQAAAGVSSLTADRAAKRRA